jgi:hypothetical protein
MKKLSSQGLIGQQGVNLVERIVLGMKYAWRPTPGFDVGIDGEIEVCDPITGAATNSYIKVQVKSTTQPFQAETSNSFEFICELRDIDYWLKGNAPVILIVSRPANNEAYWVSIKDYFLDPAIQKTRKVLFDKQLNRFNENCASMLKSLALPADSGVYFSPLDTTETLYTNLLPVKSFAQSIYVAETSHRELSEIWEKLKQLKVEIGSEWVLKNKVMMSFHPLDEFPFDKICDIGSCERFDVDEWSDSDDEDKKRDFVQLLNMSLKQRTKLLGLYYHKIHGFYYFPAPHNLSTVRIEYQSVQKRSGREVFKQYSSKSEPVRKTYCRHSAFKGPFVRLGNAWFLEITPTYHFTRNGRDDYPYREELLKGIKRLERNPAVVGQLLMWVDFLKRPIENLFSKEYPFLSFGDLKTVTLDAGIPDNTWYEAEEDIEKQTLAEKDNQPELFGL